VTCDAGIEPPMTELMTEVDAVVSCVMAVPITELIKI
jgi:hypothetical protein